jgi:hypothetical protein
MPRESKSTLGHSRSILRRMAWSIDSLVAGVVTTPIFQAGHGSIPFARSNQKPLVRRPPLTFSTNALSSIRHPGQAFSKPSASQSVEPRAIEPAVRNMRIMPRLGPRVGSACGQGAGWSGGAPPDQYAQSGGQLLGSERGGHRDLDPLRRRAARARGWCR